MENISEKIYISDIMLDMLELNQSNLGMKKSIAMTSPILDLNDLNLELDISLKLSGKILNKLDVELHAEVMIIAMLPAIIILVGTILDNLRQMSFL